MLSNIMSNWNYEYNIKNWNYGQTERGKSLPIVKINRKRFIGVSDTDQFFTWSISL